MSFPCHADNVNERWFFEQHVASRNIASDNLVSSFAPDMVFSHPIMVQKIVNDIGYQKISNAKIRFHTHNKILATG